MVSKVSLEEECLEVVPGGVLLLLHSEGSLGECGVSGDRSPGQFPPTTVLSSIGVFVRFGDHSDTKTCEVSLSSLTSSVVCPAQWTGEPSRDNVVFVGSVCQGCFSTGDTRIWKCLFDTGLSSLLCDSMFFLRVFHCPHSRRSSVARRVSRSGGRP